MNITPELIPHSEFHTGIWLQNIENPGWYYFLKQKNKNTISNSSFLDSVDEPLKKLVGYLHNKNIKTTPSCAGHLFPKQHLGRLFDTLKSDRDLICGPGIVLVDNQTGKRFNYKNRNYSLPWSKQIFIEKLYNYQQKGILGIRTGGRKKIEQEILNLKLNSVSVYKRDSIVFISCDYKKENPGHIIWDDITREIINIVDAALPSAL